MKGDLSPFKRAIARAKSEFVIATEVAARVDPESPDHHCVNSTPEGDLMKLRKLKFLLVALALLLAGCSSSAPNPSNTPAVVVGFSQLGSESGWRIGNTASMEQAAKDWGFGLMLDNANQRQEKQIAAIRSFISYQVDVIVFSPIVETGWDNVLREARQAGIPVILMDRMLHVDDESLYTAYIGADFLACVCMCRGLSEALGIELAENFKQPYLSRSIQEFWRKWHMSLSSWLRDYVYIPLGGSRKGKMKKYVNLILTFLVSGAWHGNGYRFVLWGLLHAVYQILGDVLRPVNKRIKRLIGIRPDSVLEIYIDRGVTFFLVMLGWIVFRANSIKASLIMIRSIFTVHNWWVLFDDSLLSLGLDWRNFVILLLSIHIMFKAEATQQRTVIRDRIMRQPLIFRWILYLAAIAVIIIFGTYGFGYNASDFIYKGF